MNKKSTLLAAALMAVSSLTVSAAETKAVDYEEWTAGNYYYLVSGGQYLSLCGTKSDSVIVTNFPNTPITKASRDSALWEITKVATETAGDVYQFKNKKTKALLSFAASVDAAPILAEGNSKWVIDKSGTGKISAYLSDGKTMELSFKGDKNAVVFNEDGKTFEVTTPASALPLSALDLGSGFSVFQLSFGDDFDGNIFDGKDIIAKDLYDEDEQSTGYMTLQVKGDEFFADNEPKYIGIDTTKITISNAEGAYGAKFVLDSTYTADVKDDIQYHSVSNAEFQQFRFTVDLKTDSLAMYVAKAPVVNGDIKTDIVDARVVYATLDNKKVLTVGDARNEDDLEYKGQGVPPFISVEKGTPSEINGGTGVYFLKSASKTATGGKYISAYNKKGEIVTMSGTPSVNSLEGQWYIKEDGGMYSIVDRKTSTSLLLKGEVFAVQGMENTFTFGGSADSITVEAQKVNLDDKFLGSANFTKAEMANNGYALNLIPADAETSDSYAITADSILQIKSGSAKEAIIFKIVAVDTMKIGGAQALKDTVSIVKYQLKSQFSDKYVAYDADKKSLKISNSNPVSLYFNINADGGKYNMEIAEGANKGKFVTADSYSSNMVLLETPAYFNFVEMDAPEYATFESGHRQFTSEVQSLTMNPSTFFAEMKSVGQDIDILKSAYEKDNFSLWTMKSDASTADRPLYFITTAVKVSDIPEAASVRHYMVSGRDSSLVYAGNPRVNFIANDTIETMKDSAKNPALWAFKVTENGNYLLENQQEVNNGNEEKFIGIINSFAVMSKTGAEFSIESVAGPVANESITDASAVKLIGGVGELTILNAGGKRISISNILGQTINSFVASSDNVNIGAARGVLIVSIEGEKAQKVIVK